MPSVIGAATRATPLVTLDRDAVTENRRPQFVVEGRQFHIAGQLLAGSRDLAFIAHFVGFDMGVQSGVLMVKSNFLSLAARGAISQKLTQRPNALNRQKWN
jgi:hypothetical protein